MVVAKISEILKLSKILAGVRKSGGDYRVLTLLVVVVHTLLADSLLTESLLIHSVLAEMLLRRRRHSILTQTVLTKTFLTHSVWFNKSVLIHPPLTGKSLLVESLLNKSLLLIESFLSELFLGEHCRSTVRIQLLLAFCFLFLLGGHARFLRAFAVQQPGLGQLLLMLHLSFFDDDLSCLLAHRLADSSARLLRQTLVNLHRMDVSEVPRAQGAVIGKFPRVDPQMAGQMRLCVEIFIAVRTLECLPRVYAFMEVHPDVGLVTTPAKLALEVGRPLLEMSTLMVLPGAGVCEPFPAVCADVRTQTLVVLLVLGQAVLGAEILAALVANKRSDAGVNSVVVAQTVAGLELLIAALHLALEFAVVELLLVLVEVLAYDAQSAHPTRHQEMVQIVVFLQVVFVLESLMTDVTLHQFGRIPVFLLLFSFELRFRFPLLPLRFRRFRRFGNRRLLGATGTGFLTLCGRSFSLGFRYPKRWNGFISINKHPPRARPTSCLRADLRQHNGSRFGHFDPNPDLSGARLDQLALRATLLMFQQCVGVVKESYTPEAEIASLPLRAGVALHC